ncbi:hypothetical protein CY34DRAFT_808437 [Suillus luteus UH-Slu-Lm8-n1]|uniref:Uncharacterized protein n=1 Tax=Suillus luteus UH-Slu-Lm8-n1 TaxID=930992 RepID=A0A0D0B632_9AGAM|nr:hypothetical protein CY34DRAFT_808437 [Suillus luteus UH-Slu-Lm8-n1]
MSFAEASEIQGDLSKQITRQAHQSGVARECRNHVGVSAKCGEVQDARRKQFKVHISKRAEWGSL